MTVVRFPADMMEIRLPCDANMEKNQIQFEKTLLSVDSFILKMIKNIFMNGFYPTVGWKSYN